MQDLCQLFDSLPQPAATLNGLESFSAVPVRDQPQWRVAKDTVGRPAALIGIIVGMGRDRPVSVSLENLTVEHDVSCRISTSVTTAVERCSLIRCLSEEREIQRCFLRILATFLPALGEAVDSRQLSIIIQRLVELFRLARRPRAQTLRGLWAELFLIARSQGPLILIQAWHTESSEHFDFSVGAERVEIKSSSTRTRVHEFSFEQAYPASGARAVAASVFVEESTNGTTLGELWDKVAKLSPTSEGRLKIERVCLQVLGEDVSEGRRAAFDWELAMESLAFFDMARIPRVRDDQPPGVHDIRFASDLALSQDLSAAELTRMGLLFEACASPTSKD